MNKIERLIRKGERLEARSLLLKARIQSRLYDLALFFEVNNLYK